MGHGDTIGVSHIPGNASRRALLHGAEASHPMPNDHTLLFMGCGEPEEVRCRIYGDDDTKSDPRVEFIRALAGDGVIDCPAYDPWVEALQQRGWLPKTPTLEKNPNGPNRIGRWTLTDKGRAEAASIIGGPL